MKEHGLLLSPAMALARHERRKTQTRRLIAPHNTLVDGRGVNAKTWAAYAFDLQKAWVDEGPSPAGNPGPYLHAERTGSGYETMVSRLYPRVQVGDKIWWKETWAETESDGGPVIAYRAGGSMMHCARGEKRRGTWEDFVVPGEAGQVYAVYRWRSSMFMPRWAARYVDTVVRVRPERIQAISDEDALAEGVAHTQPRTWLVPGTDINSHESASDCYRLLFKRINGAQAWERNCWVWVYEWELNG